MSESLWPNGVEIEVLGLTGDPESGKTLFGLTIAAPERTLVYDMEKSSSVYKSLGFHHVDLHRILSEKFPNGYGPVDIYTTWKQLILDLQPGKWDVIMLDPADDMEQGLVEYVARNASKYGFSTPESFKKSGGIFWGYVRAEWKQLIIGHAATRCQTFVFTTHLRTVWRDGSPTKEKEPKGKETLLESATLYLWLDREPDAEGVVPVEPRAKVHKTRLCSFQKVDGRIKKVPILPPRLPVATPDSVREYIINPPDYTALKEEERADVQVLTEYDRLSMEARIATEKREAAEATALAEERRLQANEAVNRARTILRPDEPAPAPKEEPKAEEEAQPQEAEGTEAKAQTVTAEDILKLIGKADEKGIQAPLVKKMKEKLGVSPDAKVTAKDFTRIPKSDYDSYLKKVEEYNG